MNKNWSSQLDSESTWIRICDVGGRRPAPLRRPLLRHHLPCCSPHLCRQELSTEGAEDQHNQWAWQVATKNPLIGEVLPNYYFILIQAKIGYILGVVLKSSKVFRFPQCNNLLIFPYHSLLQTLWEIPGCNWVRFRTYCSCWLKPNQNAKVSILHINTNS